MSWNMKEQFDDLRIDPSSEQVCPNPTCNGSCPVHCPRDDNMTTRRRRLLPSLPLQSSPVFAHLHRRLLPHVDEAERARRIALLLARFAQASSRRDNWLKQRSNSESMAHNFHVAVDMTTTSDDSSSEFDRYKAEARAARRIQKTKKRYSGGDKRRQPPH